MTMSNGFFGENKNINIRNINSNLNINEIKKLKQRKNIKSNNINKINKINSKDMKRDPIPTSFIKKDNNQKMVKEINKRLNKSINNRRNKNNNIANVNNINKKQYNMQTHKVKFKASPIHSKNDSNISTERSNNYQKNKKIITNNINNKNNKYAQNRSLSKDHFETEPIQKLNFNKNYINNKVSIHGIHGETLTMNMSNKNNVIKTKYFRNKINEYEKEKINNKLNENDSNTQNS